MRPRLHSIASDYLFLNKYTSMFIPDLNCVFTFHSAPRKGESQRKRKNERNKPFPLHLLMYTDPFSRNKQKNRAHFFMMFHVRSLFLKNKYIYGHNIVFFNRSNNITIRKLTVQGNLVKVSCEK